jgi:glycosyltransferase involved in cell wall biosynthesis
MLPRESFGNAIVEAMASGLPVVARAVLRYVDNPEITKMHGKNARAHVDTAYNVVRQSKEFAAHIERFL